jgi:hypothetical protein
MFMLVVLFSIWPTQCTALFLGLMHRLTHPDLLSAGFIGAPLVVAIVLLTWLARGCHTPWADEP